MTSTRPNASRTTFQGYPSSGYEYFDASDISDEPMIDAGEASLEDEEFVDTPQGYRKSRAIAFDETFNIVEEDDAYQETTRKRADEVLDDVQQNGYSLRHRSGTVQYEDDDLEEEVYRDDEGAEPARGRNIVMKEIFEPCPDFEAGHSAFCESCGISTDDPLIPCQGCSLAFHQDCLGARVSRQHLVTKVGENDFVLQCKYCSWTSKRGNDPDRSLCQHCGEKGHGCEPFRHRKTAIQEQQERDNNYGIDPETDIPADKLENLEDMLTRCDACLRAWHSDCLSDENAQSVFEGPWICDLCAKTKPYKISNIIAWRPNDISLIDDEPVFSLVSDDDKEYLIKFDGFSYAHAAWFPGAWVFKKASVSTRNAFAKTLPKPKKDVAAAIPEDYLAAEAILAVVYSNGDTRQGAEVDKARIRDVRQALIKFKGLPHEQIFWEARPSSSDTRLWPSFVAAYNDFVNGRYVKHLPPSQLAHNVANVRGRRFGGLGIQPRLLTGQLLPHQLKGMNWILTKWHSKTNAILGDEMGLGKTIQVIAFLAALVEQVQCFPFLIVVPNSTVPNWKREVSVWAPDLKASVYYGSRKAREVVVQYELFPGGTKTIQCHIVIMSYEAASDANTAAVFKGVSWQGLVVDEGQRLKNDESQLYTALQKLKVPFSVLLTGTPLQNNPRELFNLLQFLDKRYKASKLEEKYDMEHLDATKIEELHKMIRPHFLRRTKEAELKFLPAMKQITLPVSMPLVQKKVYRTILAKDADLMRAILGAHGSSKPERASLNNIVMQLRKCLAHPFVYASDIEERMVDAATAHKNLVEASSKLKLLEQMLPLLRAGGRRVLIFSQFLDMLTLMEDFLHSLHLPYQRLDGNIMSLEKQRRIDHFNAPGSEDFAFLLSTRAGGVGINLATADTVIILDPDWNPHQDSQAIARAHRIGQKSNVLCFKLMTVASVEERVMAMGKRKMALDKALIHHIDEDDAGQDDMITVLRHGVQEVFRDASDKDIIYDDVKLAALLDRSNIQHSDAADPAAHAWSFADDDTSNNELVTLKEWKEIEGSLYTTLQEREKKAKAAVKPKNAGRGHRIQRQVKYTSFSDLEGEVFEDEESFAQENAEEEAESEFSVSDAESEGAKPKTKGMETPDKPTTARKIRSTRGAVVFKLARGRVSKPRKKPAAVKTPVKRGRPRKKTVSAAAVDSDEHGNGGVLAQEDGTTPGSETAAVVPAEAYVNDATSSIPEIDTSLADKSVTAGELEDAPPARGEDEADPTTKTSADYEAHNLQQVNEVAGRL